MHAITRGVARSSRGPSRHACRIISGVRHPLPIRNFHRSAVAYRIPENPDDPQDPKADGSEARSGENPAGQNGAETLESVPEVVEEPPRPRIRSENGFAATRRAARNKRPREVPPLVLPEWFWERNVLCMGEDEIDAWRRISSRGLGFVGGAHKVTPLHRYEAEADSVMEDDQPVSDEVAATTTHSVNVPRIGPDMTVTEMKKEMHKLLDDATSIFKSTYEPIPRLPQEDSLNSQATTASNTSPINILDTSEGPNVQAVGGPSTGIKELEEVKSLEFGERAGGSLKSDSTVTTKEQATSLKTDETEKDQEDKLSNPLEVANLISREFLEKVDSLESRLLEQRSKAITAVNAGASTGFTDPAEALTDLANIKRRMLLARNLRERGNPYYIESDVYHEIVTSIRTGLRLAAPRDVEIKELVRPDLLLQCPREDGTSFLDEVILRAASRCDADIVRLNSEDLAQIIGPYLGENIAWTRRDTSLLGYEVHRSSGKHEMEDKEDRESEDTMDDPDEDESMSSATRPSPFRPAESISSYFKKMPMVFLQQTRLVNGNGLPSMQDLLRSSGDSGIHGPQNPSPPNEGWQDFKLTAALEALIDAAEVKRERLTASPEEAAKNQESEPKSKSLIIQINEYKELSKTPHGSNILSKLREVAKKRWHEGKSLMIIGTTTAEDPVPAKSRSSITRLQSDVVFGDHRTIFIPPGRAHTDKTEEAFSEDERTRVRDMNIRHVEDMTRKLLGENTSIVDLRIAPGPDVSERGDFLRGFLELEDSVWEYARVHRIASTMVGNYANRPTEGQTTFGRENGTSTENPPHEFRFMSLCAAIKLLRRSDEAKFDWAREERKLDNGADDTIEREEQYDTVSESKKTAKARMDKLKKTCNPHEVKLLGGIIEPSDIHTTFADVRAPPQTIEALKTLTSLSLIRPESFSYGVLATDKIPGLLLYGPPGTGKTLLAKAVAKESGATVLEVSAAQINDMYVGEGEKNVKAVFSLAKKLSPCVVFIDEADALFGARGDSNKRSSHRELINQFLREWDGMNDLSAFIMVATNRPFDLDEAVLRRLPRRLLIDLPLEKDREAILNIHLKGEVLDESISLASLATDTPFYSGSDLKNLSVAAALACVRDENEAAKNHVGEEPYVFPPKRILTKKHFDKAMEEISASISEDMSTLTAIRKFDERYGDRKGRRKRGSGLGFGGTKVEEKDSEAGRVRKMEVGNAA